MTKFNNKLVYKNKYFVILHVIFQLSSVFGFSVLFILLPFIFTTTLLSPIIFILGISGAIHGTLFAYYFSKKFFTNYMECDSQI